VFISVTRTADPGYLAERDPEQEELRLISRPELRFFRRRPSDSAVTGRQGRAFRVRNSWRPVTVPACAADLLSPLRPVAWPRRASMAARSPNSPALPSRNRTSLHPPSTRASLTWACVPSLGAAGSSPGYHAAHMSELTATLLPAASHTRLAFPQPPTTLFYRQGPVSVWESAGRSGSATTGAFRV
jgi:hypothetical protein